MSRSNRAYRDPNRIICFKGLDKRKREQLRGAVYVYLEQEINKLSVENRVDFHKWHYKVCDYIRMMYRKAGIQFTYGQA